MCNEVLASLGNCVTVKFDVEWTLVGLDPDITLLLNSAEEDNLIVQSRCLDVGHSVKCCRCQTGGTHAGGVGGSVELVRLDHHLILRLLLDIGPLQLRQGVSGLVVNLLELCHGTFAGAFILISGLQTELDMMIIGEVKLCHIPWILQDNDIGSGEWLVIEQIFEVLCFQVQLFYCLIAKYIASCFDDSNMSRVVVHLEHDGTVELSCSILTELQLDQPFRVERLAGAGIHLVLFNKRQNVQKIKNMTLKTKSIRGYFKHVSLNTPHRHSKDWQTVGD